MTPPEGCGPDDPAGPVSVGPATIARQWGRIGVLGFGGPPTHIAMLRRLCVTERQWLSPTEFEDGIAATNLLPGPASTQLAIFCAWRLGGTLGAVVGGVCFIVPGLVAILALSVLFFAAHPPMWVLGAAAGAGGAVPAVAVHAASGLMPASWRRAGDERAARGRWVAYALAGGAGRRHRGPVAGAGAGGLRRLRDGGPCPRRPRTRPGGAIWWRP